MQQPGGCPTGEAKITDGYRLPARRVIHTVGPVWQGRGSNEDELLASCYRNSLELAALHNLNTVAFPAISTGAYGFPIERATRIALRQVAEFLDEDEAIREVTFVCHSEKDLLVYGRLLEKETR